MSRLSQLQQRVSEALWRYQLLLQDSVVKEFGSVTLRPTTDTGVHNDDGYGKLYSERSLAFLYVAAMVFQHYSKLSSSDEELNRDTYPKVSNLLYPPTLSPLQQRIYGAQLVSCLSL